MSGMSFSDFNALPDVLAVDRFEILISPNGQDNTNQTLALRCVQCTLPEVQIEPMIVAIQGMEFVFRGRNTYDKQISAAFVETIDGSVQAAIRSWKENIVGSESQNGQTKKQYSTQGTINVIDQSGNIALTYLIDNMWPSQFPQVQLDGSQAQPFIQQVLFTYDRFEPPAGVGMN
jgi:hypothetical protein